MKKNQKVSIIYFICIFILVLFSRFRWDIIIRTNYLVGTITSLLMIITYVGLLIFAIVYTLKGIKSDFKRYCFPLITIMLFSIFYSYIVYTPLYAKIEYFIHEHDRNKVIQMVSEGDYKNLQINYDTYMAPFRLSSYDGLFTIHVNNGNEYVIFNTYIGYKKNTAVVYSPVKLSIDANVLNSNWRIVTQYDDNWLSVIIKT